MTDEAKKYVTRTFNATAMQVTADNLVEVARWCDGVVRGGFELAVEALLHYVELPWDAGSDKAFIGDWVVLRNKEFRRWPDKTFHVIFKPDIEAAIRELVNDAIYFGDPEYDDEHRLEAETDSVTAKIMKIIV